MGSVIAAVIALGVLVVATNQGQFASITSFAAGAGVAALTSVLVGGGTTFAYMTGGVEQQHAVRVVRALVVLPAVVLASGAAAGLYAGLGALHLLGVLAGGLSTLASVGAELDAAYLRRHLRTWHLLAADIAGRLMSLVIVVGGVDFAYAMAGGAILRAGMLYFAARNDPARPGPKLLHKKVLTLAYETKLTSTSILYSACDRLGSLIGPLVAPIPVAGGFQAVLSSQQNASGALVSGLQTTLAVRAQHRLNLKWASRVDALLLAAALFAAVVMVVWREPLTSFLGLAAMSRPEAYWVALAALIPAAVASRMFEFQFMAAGQTKHAMLSRTAATAVGIVGGIVALANGSIEVLAWGLLGAEVTSVLTSASARLLERRRADCNA
ncbi:hypothetical protein GCM10027064_13970 [Microbacterium petrolearium]